jgi:glycosyltransferase involved in cell wall biosynthesis
MVIMSDGKSRADAFRSIHRYTGRIEYIYNCAGRRAYSPAGYDLRAKLSLSEYTRIVLYIGIVDIERGLESTVKAVAGYGSGVHLVMMGPVRPSFRTRLEVISQALEIGGRVHFVDAVPTDDVPLWASSADVAVTLIQPYSLSYKYSAPTKMFEALMAHVPQVASDFPEIRRVLIDNGVGPAGILVDPEDQKAVATSIRTLLDNRSLRTELSANARILATATYNWENQEKALLTLYAELLNSRN